MRNYDDPAQVLRGDRIPGEEARRKRRIEGRRQSCRVRRKERGDFCRSFPG